MTTPTEKTDIIPGLRPHDTAGEPLLAGAHRRRRRGMPRWAWCLLWGVPAAAVAGVAGWSLGGTPHSKPPTVVASSPNSSDSTAAVSPAPLPSTADAPSVRLTAPHTAPEPSPTWKATRPSSPRPTPSPTPTRTHEDKPAPSPTRTHASSSPAPSDTDTPPTPSDSPEATDGR